MTAPTVEDIAGQMRGCRKIVFSRPSVGPVEYGCEGHGYPWPCPEQGDVAHLLTEWEHQVRADERGHVSILHGTLTDEQLLAELVRRRVLEREARYDMSQKPVRREVRYGSDWLVDTRTEEQRSDDAITTLRRRLSEGVTS